MRKLILHAGTHKTGTTAIQSFARENSKSFLSQGILYPDYAPFNVKFKDGHHDFAHSLAESTSTPMTFEQGMEIPRIWFDKASEYSCATLISAEAVWRHKVGSKDYKNSRRKYLTLVRQALQDFDVEVIIVFRRPDDYIRSLYQETITKQTKRLAAFPVWREATEPKRLGYFENFCLFREIFSSARCLLYEDLISGDGLLKNFFRELGVNTQGMVGPGFVRRSLKAHETVIKNFANPYLKTNAKGKEFVRWLQSENVSNTIKNLMGGDRFDLWETYEARAGFIEGRRDDIARLGELCLSGRERVFPELSKTEMLESVPNIPESVQNMVFDHLGVEKVKRVYSTG